MSAELKRNGEGAPTTRPLFQAYFTFTKIVIGQNYLIFLVNLIKQFVMCKNVNVLKGNTIGPCLSGIVCVDQERSRPCQMQRMHR